MAFKKLSISSCTSCTFWILAIANLASLSTTLVFLGLGAADTTSSATIVVVLLASFVTLAFVVSQSLVVGQINRGQTASRLRLRHRLDSVFGRLPALIVICWIVAAAIGLVVASRQPLCRLQQHHGLSWQTGFSCRLYRAIVALSVFMFVLSCSLFWLREITARRSGNTITTCREKNASTHSALSASLDIPSRIGRDDQLYLIPETRTSRIEHERWLQRRDSLSSQKAVFPSDYRTFERGRRGRTIRRSSRLSSLSETSTTTFVDLRSSSTLSSGNTLNTSSSAASISGRSSSYGECPFPPLTDDHYHFECKNGPAESTGNTSCAPIFRDPSPPPPAWCPSLRQTPLGLDPAILALTIGSQPEVSSSGQSSNSFSPFLPARDQRRLRTSSSSSARMGRAPISLLPQGSNQTNHLVSSQTFPTSATMHGLATRRAPIGSRLPYRSRPIRAPSSLYSNRASVMYIYPYRDTYRSQTRSAFA